MFMNSLADCHREIDSIDDGTNLGALWDWDSVQLVAGVSSPPESSSKSVRPKSGLGAQAQNPEEEVLRDGEAESSMEGMGSAPKRLRRTKSPQQVSAAVEDLVKAFSPGSVVEGQGMRAQDKSGRDATPDCPNFASGRTACGCTDSYEEEDVVSRKRTKAAAKCQVEACRANLGKLKGYHQRHRVCLGCANAITVMLRGEAHRYCQQCGKFHVLSDFDEEKRSCRRKLERHNTRRRRKMMEAGNEVGACSNEKEQGSADGQADEDKSSPSPGRENSGSMGQAPGSLEFDTEPASKLSSTLTSSSPLDELPFLVDGCETIVSPSIDSLKTSLMRGLSHSSVQSTEPRGVQSLLVETSSHSVHASGPEAGLQAVQSQGVASNIYPANIFQDQADPSSRLPSHNIEQLPSGEGTRDWSIPHGSSGFNSVETGCEDESLLAFLLEDHEDNFFPKSVHLPGGQDPNLHFHDSASYRGLPRKAPTYSSPFPTGRISFKLYDWNPGDFPRSLRQQILEWIGNMPVELEGYIRSGCTILTLFLSMHQKMWDDLEESWPTYLEKLIQGSGKEFWGSGHYVACVGGKGCEVKEGNITEIYDDCAGKVAQLDHVWPICLEAGSAHGVHLYGTKLRKGEVRPYVSFCGTYLSVDRNETEHHSPAGKDGSEKGSMSCQIQIPAVSSGRCGVAYVELENNHGTSNYVPVLVADRQICAELQTLTSRVGLFPGSLSVDSSRHGWKMIHRVLLDLGWVLSYAERYNTPDRLDTFVGRDWHTLRLRRLLKFALLQNWPIVAGRIISSATICSLGLPAEIYQCPQMTLNMGDMYHPANAGFGQQIEPLEQRPGVAAPWQGKQIVPVFSARSSDVVVPIKDAGHDADEVENLKEPLICEKIYVHRHLGDLWMEKRSRRSRYGDTAFVNEHLRIGRRSIMTMVGVLAVCVGACFIFQHPQETMDYLSGSLRRCLWGSMGDP